MLNVIIHKMQLPNPEFQIIPNIHNYKTHQYAITNDTLNYNILPNLKTIQQIQPNAKNVQKKTQEIYQEYKTLWEQNLKNITHEYL